MPTYGIAIFPQRPDDFIALCKQVDDGPFDQIWVPDERFYRDFGVALTLAALHSRRVRIGSAVTDPFIRHPALTASLMATLDELSGGRVVVGVGAGISGFKELGVAQEKPQLAIREMVTLMRELWKGGRVSFEGKTTSFRDGMLDYTPTRKDISVWIAGRGPHVLQLAGEIGDGVMVGALASATTLRYAFAQIERGLAKKGRDPSTLSRAVWLHTAVSENGDAARDAVRTIVAGALVSSLPVLGELGIELQPGLVDQLRTITYGTNNPEMQRVAETFDDDLLRHLSCAGTPDEVREQIGELSRIGIQHLAIVPWLTKGQTMPDFVDTLARTVAA
jgi:5,10-methylenetetrahydromethanopterin reductase